MLELHPTMQCDSACLKNIDQKCLKDFRMGELERVGLY